MSPVLKGTQILILISVMGPVLAAPTAGTENAAALTGFKFCMVTCSEIF